jgi:hypothetical protein
MRFVGHMLMVVVVVALVDCHVSTSPVPRPPSPAVSAVTTSEDVTTTSADVPIGPPEDTEGFLAPVRGRLQECAGPTGGKVTVRVRYVDGVFLFNILPSSTLDPRQGKCIYDALTENWARDNPTLWTGGAGIPPSGFTSHLTIAW